MRAFHHIKIWAPLAVVFGTQWVASWVHAEAKDTYGLDASAKAAEITFLKGDLPTVVGLAINIAFGLVGSIFLILMIYAGILWMTAAGNSDTVDKAKGIIKTAIIGIIVTFGSYAITSYVFSLIGQVAVGK